MILIAILLIIKINFFLKKKYRSLYFIDKIIIIRFHSIDSIFKSSLIQVANCCQYDIIFIHTKNIYTYVILIFDP